MQEFIYQDRVVAFIDVLGFHEKLSEFENDAKTKKLEEGGEYLVSEKVNEFLNTFKEVISLLDRDNLRYYLFSDNICITIDYLENPNLLISLLVTVSQLFYAFAQKGYFLRGGIDVGKFIDEKQIALGIPLARAYALESKDAVFPRILISDRYYELIKDHSEQNKITEYSSLNIDNLIYKSCEFYYLNVFFNVTGKEDKGLFFSSFREKILENLLLNSKKEKIFIKYQWLVEQYDSFLEIYYTTLIFNEEEDPLPEVIDYLKTLKIK